MADNANEIQPEILPVSGSPGTTKNEYFNIIEAVSQIQQYAVIEGSGQEIPDNFLTVEGKLNFLKVGLGSGFLEGIIFTALTAIILPIMADPYLAQYVAKYFPLAGYKTFLILFNCLPIFIMVTISCFLTRFRIGTITRKSVDAFLFGRVFSLVGKGLLIFGGFIFIAKHIDVKNAWCTAKILTFWGDTWVTELIYRVVWNLKPFLIRSAFEVLVIFGVAAFIPFLATWLLSTYRGYKRHKEEKFWNE
jgi:hypothetical protein